MRSTKSIYILSCILFFPFSSLQSQLVIVPGSEVILDKLRINESMDGVEYETYATVAGDPFIYRDFHEGELTLKNGETYRLNLRFDIYGNQVHLKNNDQIYGIIHPEKVASIVIDTLTLLYCNYVNSPADNSSGEGSYFILKTDGKCKLLLKKNIRIQDAEPSKGLQDAKPAKFVHLGDTYYLKQEGKNAIRINGKKDLLTVLGDKKDEINRLIKTEKLGRKNPGELVKIVSYYNSL
jgi:hypothetical protein